MAGEGNPRKPRLLSKRQTNTIIDIRKELQMQVRDRVLET